MKSVLNLLRVYGGIVTTFGYPTAGCLLSSLVLWSLSLHLQAFGAVCLWFRRLYFMFWIACGSCLFGRRTVASVDMAIDCICKSNVATRPLCMNTDVLLHLHHHHAVLKRLLTCASGTIG